MTLPVVHWSSLKYIGQSPLHYAYRLAHDTGVTPAMRLGTLCHELVLDQPLTSVVYEGERRGKAWMDFKAAHEGREIVTERELHEAEMIAASVAGNMEASHLLRGVREQPIQWQIGSRACAGRPDVVSADGSTLVEFKTTADANPLKFQWHARRMGWLAQLAWYGNGIALAHGRRAPERYVIVAVETRAPYVVQAYELTPQALVSGEKQWRACWERLLSCEESDTWPGYSQTILDLDVPEEIELDFGDEAEAAE